MREERKWFKNLRIHLTDLSSATSILDEQWGAESRPKRAKSEMPTTTLRPNQDFREMEFNPKRLRQSLLSIPNTSSLTNGMWGILRKIIIEEVGLEEEDLEDDPDFASLGIDSLMSLRILGRLRENLEVDLGGMDFDQYPNVRELRKFFEHFHPGQETPHKSLRTQSTPKTLTPTNGTWGIVRKIIIEEVGLEEEDLEDDLDFADVGIDSLMSLTILGRLRENLEVDLGGMIFDQYPNVRELRKFFERFYPGQETPHKSLRTQSTPQTDPLDGKEIL
jgi:acyl carrier protein